MSLDLEDVAAVTENLLRRADCPVLLYGERIAVDVACAPNGLLPLFILTGEALWREVMGEATGFAVKTEADDGALIGYRLKEIGAGPFTAVMLAAMEALWLAKGIDGILVEKLPGIRDASVERFEAERNAARRNA